jgi:hypothetical protein
MEKSNIKYTSDGKKVKVIFAWYDLWVGIFYDQKKRYVYIFPIPMLGILIELKGGK